MALWSDSSFCTGESNSPFRSWPRRLGPPQEQRGRAILSCRPGSRHKYPTVAREGEAANFLENPSIAIPLLVFSS
jgi:hypothetical protein